MINKIFFKNKNIVLVKLPKKTFFRQKKSFFLFTRSINRNYATENVFYWKTHFIKNFEELLNNIDNNGSSDGSIYNPDKNIIYNCENTFFKNSHRILPLDKSMSDLEKNYSTQQLCDYLFSQYMSLELVNEPNLINEEIIKKMEKIDDLIWCYKNSSNFLIFYSVLDFKKKTLENGISFFTLYIFNNKNIKWEKTKEGHILYLTLDIMHFFPLDHYQKITANDSSLFIEKIEKSLLQNSNFKDMKYEIIEGICVSLHRIEVKFLKTPMFWCQ